MNAKSLIAALAIMAASLTACQSSESSVSSRTQEKANPAPWVTSITPEDVKTLSPDEAKAILLAHAVIENNAKRAGRPAPEILHFYPKATADGWDVHVEYVAFWDNGRPYSGPGFFTDVLIGRDWQIIRMSGGA